MFRSFICDTYLCKCIFYYNYIENVCKASVCKTVASES